MTEILVLVGVGVGAWLALSLVLTALRLTLRGGDHPLGRSLTKNLGLPGLIVAPLVAVEIATPALDFGSSHTTSVLLHAFGIALDLAVGFLIVRGTYVLDDLVLSRYRIDQADNLRARQVQTQIQVFRRIVIVAVSFISFSIALLSFSAVRAAGAGLLASAGVIGIVAGIAARPIATNVFAGLQIAISQPIRVDDVVVVEGEWGRVEEIALTYVVVRVWDLRRLVLPISYFIENPFENWTRRTSAILGWVFIEVDYSAPIDAIRRRFDEILRDSPGWDRQVNVLQVTNAGPTSLQLRCLMSSVDSSTSWNLQCEVREKLVTYLQESHPGALPRQRAQLVDDLGGDVWRFDARPARSRTGAEA